MTNFLLDMVTNPVYLGLMLFVGLYPLVTSLIWLAGSLLFLWNRETAGEAFFQLDDPPPVSVVMAARNEEAVIERTIESLLCLDWPDYEIMVVDDGSDDRTPQILQAYAERGEIRVLRKQTNEGKAMALNDALPLLRSEIVLLLDADARPQPDVLRHLVPHLVKLPWLGAVTGNPRVANTPSMLAKLQVIEFAATVSILRRAQATWGHIMTISGVSTCFRKSAVESVGRFQPQMATEDIALTWQLQRAGFEIRYEPRAIFAMQVPEDLRTWWKQRTRWAKGMGQVLRRDKGIFAHWSQRRLWPIYIEASLSAMWSHLFCIMTVTWVAAAALTGLTSVGANPQPAIWGLIVATVCAVQIAIGLVLDGRYDRPVRGYLLYAGLYPLAYWLLLSLAALRSTIPGLAKTPRGAVTWTQSRYATPAGRPSTSAPGEITP